MKRALALFMAFIMIIWICPVDVRASEKLSEQIIFTWAWNANKIEKDGEVTVVSWSGGNNASYRSSFVVCDLPEDFTYESVKSEVIASFAINSATLNNGTNGAPTAAIVMVDGDKVKEAYSLKSGATAAALLTEAKNGGVFLGNYKIGKYPRTSRIKNANINAFFEKHPDVESIGFYITNLQSDGYGGMVDGIASAMTEIDVDFEASNNYTNATLKMVDSEGNLLDSSEIRGETGTVVNIPHTLNKDGDIWVRDDGGNIYLSDTTPEIIVTYHLDKADREKYVSVIEDIVWEMVKSPVKDKLDLPKEYIADDGFIIKIEWVSSDENVVAGDGTVYQGVTAQSAQLYAVVWIGDYTSIETKRFTVTVTPLNQSETDEALIFAENFNDEIEMRGSFTGESLPIDVQIENEFTISAFVRIDDVSKGGIIFDINGVKLEAADMNGCKEGQWYHVAVTDTALYIDGEKNCDITTEKDSEESHIGAYTGKMDNLYVYNKAFSQSVIKELSKEEYDSPKLEVVNAFVIEGMDAVLIRASSHGYSKEAVAVVTAEVDSVSYSGYCENVICEGVNVFSVTVPNMGGGLTKENISILLWDGISTMTPVCDKTEATGNYTFGFDYAQPDNHLLSNTFTLMDTERNLYLTGEGLSQRRNKGLWTGKIKDEGYYYLENEDGDIIDGKLTFEQVDSNVYRIKNNDTGEYISYSGNDEWTLNITEYNDVSRAFVSEGFFLLTSEERNSIYNVTGQTLTQSSLRREKLCEIINDGYFDLDGEEQAEALRGIITYSPAYQVNRVVNEFTTGIEAEYSLSSITWTNYTDIDGYSKSGYTAKATYAYAEGDVEIEIFARSQNVVRNIAKGFSYMPYQFIKPLKKVVDYNQSNNQFKAEVGGSIYIETNYEVSSENVAITGAHELGHLIDFAANRMSIGDYKGAREVECSVSGYADTALGEDFAEFCQFVISCSGDEEKLRQLEGMYPGRFKALCEGMCEMYGECYLK